MDVSRITSGKLKFKIENDVNLTSIVSQVAEFYRPEFNQAHRTLQLHLQPQVTGNWDAMRLSQVITNLISNSLKYGGTKPVEFHLTANENQATLRVKDYGIGIPATQLDRIFHRFERGIAENFYPGMGLGLWITRQVVEALSGKISIKSELRIGSEFTVELPRHPIYSDEITG